MIRPRRWGNGRRSVDCIGGIMSRFSLKLVRQAFSQLSLCGLRVRHKVGADKAFIHGYAKGWTWFAQSPIQASGGMTMLPSVSLVAGRKNGRGQDYAHRQQ